jgi:hypothetical protein
MGIYQYYQNILTDLTDFSAGHCRIYIYIYVCVCVCVCGQKQILVVCRL